MNLKCNSCPQNPTGDYCNQIKEVLRNGCAKLYYGGIIGDAKHVGICISKQFPGGCQNCPVDGVRCVIIESCNYQNCQCTTCTPENMPINCPKQDNRVLLVKKQSGAKI